MSPSPWSVLPADGDGPSRKAVLEAVAGLSEAQRTVFQTVVARLAIDPLAPGVIAGDPTGSAVTIVAREYDRESVAVTAEACELTLVCRAWPATGVVRIMHVIAGP